MFTSAAAHKHDWRASERRSCHREPVQWAVLVFFADNWGKLMDLSEKGMSFQFEHAPSLREPIHFTFETMGCMPIPHDGKVFNDSIQVTGQVVWAHEFERTAGVQFLELSSRSREQIRYWMSSVPSRQAASRIKELHTEWNKWPSNEVLQEEPPPFAPPEALTSSAKTALEPVAETRPCEAENLDSGNELLWEPNAPFSPQRRDLCESEAELPPESEPAFAPQRSDPPAHDSQSLWDARPETMPQRLEPLAFKTPAMLRHEERQKHGQTLELKQQRSRIGPIAVLGFLVALGAIAGIIGFISKFNGGAEVAGGVSRPSEKPTDPSTTEGRMVAKNTSPFLVEVLDTNNRRSILWLSNEAHPNAPDRIAQDSSLPWAPATSLRKTINEQKPATAERREPFHDFSLVSPRTGLPGANASAENSAALVAPALSGEMPTSVDMPLHEILPTPAMPAPVERTPRLGGDVQPARLIHAALPIYPQIAKANRAAGDVTLDALVDESGNVRDVKVISGPILLREAAKEALRQWKYEPARLDGRPTAMHLTVTVKFKYTTDNR